MYAEVRMNTHESVCILRYIHVYICIHEKTQVYASIYTYAHVYIRYALVYTGLRGMHRYYITNLSLTYFYP